MDIAKLHLHYRSSKYKGQTYRSYSLARAYRRDGKNRKEIVLKLGKLSHEEIQRWRMALRAAKEPGAVVTTLEDIAVRRHYAYLDVAVANAVWDEWALDGVFAKKGRRELTVASVARILALNRCIDPSTKSQATQWFDKTALPYLLEVEAERFNPSRVFRELAVIEEHKEALCKYVFERMSKRNPDAMQNVFYDLSSTTFTGARCVLVKWGHCKEGYRNHVVLALVVNRDGLPFYWEVLPGGTTDATTIAWLLDRLKERFQVSQTTLVFDRGMVSEENLALLEQANIQYISAMDRNQIEGITALDLAKFSHQNAQSIDEQAPKLPRFTRLDDTTYYREVKVIGKRRYILCFNTQLFKDQRKARAQAVVDFEGFRADLNAELRQAKRERRRKTTYAKFKQQLSKTKLDKFVDVTLKAIDVKRKSDKGKVRSVRTYQATVQVHQAPMQLAGKLDGFWLLVTNLKDKQGRTFKVAAPDVIRPYRDKVVIESSFRDIKSFVEVAPVHVWTPSHVKAHYTLCVLAHLINRTLTLRLHAHPGNASKDIVSHQRLYSELSGCQFDHIELKQTGASTLNTTVLTNKQKDLLQRLSLTHLTSRNIIHKINSALAT